MTGASILVHVDATHEWGLAHAVRCANLLACIRVPLDITVIGEGQLDTWFPDATILTVKQAQPQDILNACETISCDAVLIDQPRFDKPAWSVLKGTLPVPLVVLDDYGGEIWADLILNGTVLPEYHHYPPQSANTKIMAGAEYALLHPAFAENKWQGGEALTIVAGGGDNAKNWLLSLTAQPALYDLGRAIQVVVGKSFPALKTLKSQCAHDNCSVHCAITSTELAHMLAHSAATLITGGMIVYEAMAVGVPSIVFPQEKNLIKEAQFFSHQNCVVDLGHDLGPDDARTLQKARELVVSPERMNTLSHNGRALIDGLGMKRAAAAIQHLIEYTKVI